MPIAAAASLVANLWMGLWPFGGHAHAPAPVPDIAGRIEAWRMVVHQDAFSGQTICVLRTHNAYVERGVVMFKLPARENVTDAVFRIDDGAVRSVRDSDVEVATAGLPVYQDGKDPQDPGLARIPAHLLQGARAVAFQLRLGGRAYRFDVRGFDAALAAATASGCKPAAFRASLR